MSEGNPLSVKVRAFLDSPHRLLIRGEWVDAVSGRTFRVMDPARAAELTRVAEADKADVDLAVGAARHAFEKGPWSNAKPAQRARLLWKLADLIEANASELAELESLDTGKPVMEARLADVPGAAAQLRYFAGWADKWSGEVLPTSLPGSHLAYTRREPLGVVGAIVPWNFPLLNASWKLGPALATGNTVVLKPSELTPLSSLRLGELIAEAKFPPGVVNIVPGYGPSAGAALAGHEDVNKIAFTGSPEVGREIMKTAARDFKRLTLELGGKSPNILFADADLKKALPGILGGIFFNQGQICYAGSRLFVERAQCKAIAASLVEGAETLRGRQGPGTLTRTKLGPLVSEAHMQRVMGYIEAGKREGATLLTGGGANPAAGPGYFVSPTVFLGTDEMAIAREEIFGPVLTLLPFDDSEEAVRRANATPYGLAAGIWSADLKRALKLAHSLEVGTVWINGYNLFDPASPWGGRKQSGFGREMGRDALEAYTEVKSVWVNLA